MINWLLSIYGRSFDYSAGGSLSNSTYNNLVFTSAGVIVVIFASAIIYLFVSIFSHIFRGK